MFSEEVYEGQQEEEIDTLKSRERVSSGEERTELRSSGRYAD